MTPGQVAYFICEDNVEKVKFLAQHQSVCVIEFYGDTQRVKEETLTDDPNKVVQHIDKQIAKHETKIAVLKAKLQDFPPLRLANE
jgi:hypothetical protein